MAIFTFMADIQWLQQDFRKFDRLDILAKQVVEGFIIGLHKSPYHGFSVEFAEHRLYNNGDPVRDVDWKVYGRTGKMYVKKFEEETNLRCQLVIDISSSMLYPENKRENALNKLEFSCISAAALMHLLKKQRDAAGLTLIGENIQVHTLCKTNAQHHQLMMNYLYNALTQQKKQIGTSLAGHLHEVAEMLHRRSLVFIFTDLIFGEEGVEPFFGALQHLRHNKHEVVIFHVRDKKSEEDFNFENRPYEFIDLESGNSVKLLPSEMQRLYREKSFETEKLLHLKCAQYNIDIVDADIHFKFDDVLQAYLLKRSKMKV